MNGFFHFPTTKKIRHFELPPFAVSALVPRPRPPKKKPGVDGIEGLLPTEPVPMDLEMNDLVKNLFKSVTNKQNLRDHTLCISKKYICTLY
jgi:hypothetical protein